MKPEGNPISSEQEYVSQNYPTLNSAEYVVGFEDVLPIYSAQKFGEKIEVSGQGMSGGTFYLSDHMLPDQSIPDDFVENFRQYKVIQRVVKVQGIMRFHKYRIEKE
ncbi:MAG: hypothetical protein GW762_00820 [Candidatus Pacebacteria bacterium]|nr:hypothetical protein [Candidatus Paceibacterota bacterium]PIR63308.1 MAG: hypothetical protein COU64_05460 [Candidatus Pacebacteria bacterium CG10_big_fil_rev_8_21_14_0_10_40_26]PIZ79189.1 MAG: hypothetical protein COY01_02050 [Candidatus Pacebacteria bacterium CG_4_10_14_0_2_um_filter_40_20]PJA68844.1 MAG: hypothetical protein CO156_02655 [Candidatus Pacebacteria bacterium CG_4_9_14_3_um_filter_40_12]PJC42155.1 MAG: hypothetical protein CO041_00760 [Candidatus Pacebacteria bacterium CG_4_9_